MIAWEQRGRADLIRRTPFHALFTVTVMLAGCRSVTSGAASARRCQEATQRAKVDSACGDVGACFSTNYSTEFELDGCGKSVRYRCLPTGAEFISKYECEVTVPPHSLPAADAGQR